MIRNEKKLYHPTPVSGRQGFNYSILFGLFVTFFLWFFEPFGMNVQAYSVFELLFFGLISFGVFVFGHTILPLIKPSIYQESNWTIYSQILFYIILSFVIATLNGLYINYRNDLGFSWSNYLQIITQTFAVGILPITLSVLFSYYLKYKKIVEQSDYINGQIDKVPIPKPQQYSIKSNIKSETFVIDAATFLFAKSDGNYIEIVGTDKPPQIFRMGLVDLEEQLAANSYMMRCHRSYLVNTKQIINVTGNAQGLKLWFQDQPINIPVSRKYLQQIKSVFENK